MDRCTAHSSSLDPIVSLDWPCRDPIAPVTALLLDRMHSDQMEPIDFEQLCKDPTATQFLLDRKCQDWMPECSDRLDSIVFDRLCKDLTATPFLLDRKCRDWITECWERMDSTEIDLW